MNFVTKVCLSPFTILSFVSCTHGGASEVAEPRSPSETGAGAESASPAAARAEARDAATAIVSMRCEREMHCDNVGESKKYSSAQDCSDRIRSDWKDALNARHCPNGVNDAELDECLAKIRGEDCSSPLDTLSRLSECTRGQICLG